MTLSTSTIPKAQSAPHIIDLTDSLPDITASLIHDHPGLYQLPSDIFEDAVFQALNDLVDEFALNPNQYLKTKHHNQINAIAEEYLHS